MAVAHATRVRVRDLLVALEWRNRRTIRRFEWFAGTGFCMVITGWVTCIQTGRHVTAHPRIGFRMELYFEQQKTHTKNNNDNVSG